MRFSPFYPHEGIPVPYSAGHFAASVEGLWQGLKVFDHHDVDLSKFDIRSMRGIKRTVRKYGHVHGHRRGIHGDELLTYKDARTELYLPSYKYVLENFLQDELHNLRQVLSKGDLVLLDYETNTDIEDFSKPLSHAGLVARYLSGGL